MELKKTTHGFLNETIYTGVHESGLPVFILSKKEFVKYYSVISVKYGSINSTFKKGGDNLITIPDGTAHYLEHKLFEQPDGTNAFDKFSKYGANANAYTSFSNTAYLFSATERFEDCLSHLLDYVFTPYFTEENVNKERGIIGQEIRMYDDDPSWKVFFNMLKGMYVNHPITKDIAGTVESIADITENVLYEAYEAFYHPANMVLFMAGNIDPGSAAEIIEKRIPRDRGGFETVPEPVNEPERISEKYISADLPVSIPIFSCGYKNNDVYLSGKELAAENLALSVALKLFSGESSPLYKKLYDEGSINDSFYDDMTLDESFGFVQFGGESENPEKTAEAILKEAERIKREGFDEKAFARIKNSLYGKYIKSFDNIETVGNAFCSNYFSGINLFDFLDIYDTITYNNVLEKAKKVFDGEKFVLSVIRPGKR